MVNVLSQVLSIALFVLAALALSVQGHRNGDSFGSSQVRSGAHSALPTHIQEIIQRRTLLHGPKGDKGGPGYGGPGYGGKSWFKGERKHR